MSKIYRIRPDQNRWGMKYNKNSNKKNIIRDTIIAIMIIVFVVYIRSNNLTIIEAFFQLLDFLSTVIYRIR